MKIIRQWIRTDEDSKAKKRCYIYSEFENGAIGMVSKSLTPEEAVQWMAERGF